MQNDGWDVETVMKEEGDEIVVVRGQNMAAMQAHADWCKARSKEGFHGLPDFKFRASIPVLVIEKYIRDQGITMREFIQNKREHLRRIINNPDNAAFKVAPGRM